MQRTAGVAAQRRAVHNDLAFQGRYAYAGTVSGLRVIDISNPAAATQIA